LNTINYKVKGLLVKDFYTVVQPQTTIYDKLVYFYNNYLESHITDDFWFDDSVIFTLGVYGNLL